MHLVLHGRRAVVVARVVGGVALLVVVQDVWWQALDDPLVLQAFLGRESLLRVPLKAAADEVDEGRIRQVTQLVHNVAETLLLLLLREHLERRRHRIVLEL